MADSASQRNLIGQFIGVAGVNEERAKFYLESAAWNLDMALASFFDAGEEGEVAGGSSAFENLRRDPTPPRHTVHDKPPSKPAGAGKKSSDTSRIATLGSLRPDESDSSGEEGQAYYAGGSEHGGGQQIIGPSKKKKGDVDSLVSGMFRAAREHGAEAVDPSTGASSLPAFQGRAYRLGDNDMQSEMLTSPDREPDHRPVEMVMKMWQNGFSVDDGPLREFHDPANQRFLQAIQKGEIPQELVQQARGGEVSLSMEDHRNEDYMKPPPVIHPFSGEGHRLGCPSDSVARANDTARSMSGIQMTPSPAAGGNVHETEAAAALNVNTSQPTTSLQIRLANGTRLIAKFNHTHRVSDVRQYIVTARPEYASANFALMTTFPNAELTDETLTLAAAKLLNAVIVQRMK